MLEDHNGKALRVAAVIPARGGSKGIPRKNLCVLQGKPLISRMVCTALESKLLDRVFVSTDDEEIGLRSKEAGAEVVWRPADLSGDAAPSELALLHALDHVGMTENYVPEILVFLQCTSPLTEPDDIDGTLRRLVGERADSAFTATRFRSFVWRRDQAGEAHAINHDKAFRPRRQVMDDQFLESGAVYVMRTAGFRHHQHRFFGKTVLYEVPAERGLEIDEPLDLALADARLAMKGSLGGAGSDGLSVSPDRASSGRIRRTASL